jgi:predicted enzyme related to lactoylglutathione lyase
MHLCQLEFYSYDLEASLMFSGKILGWKRVPVAIQGQAIIAVPDQSPYGISIRERTKPEAFEKLPALTSYFEVNRELEAIRDECAALGATIIQEPTAITGYGRVMLVEDKGGLRYGLYEARFEGPRRSVPKN